MKSKKTLAVFTVILLCLLLLFSFLIYKKIIKINHPSNKKYPITGVDVSHYQGDIDWSVLASQNIDFTFIKATEGSSTVDKKFKQNWTEAQETSIALGAYHFFSFDSSVETQAENYIEAVGSLSGKLPPVIDFEFYRDYESNPPDVSVTRDNLRQLLDILENHYGAKPIIYATVKSYNMYIKDCFDDYPLWIRNVYYSPNLGMKNKWVFWQYSDTAVLKGYEGTEEYIDMNVFNGTEEEFEKMILK